MDTSALRTGDSKQHSLSKPTRASDWYSTPVVALLVVLFFPVGLYLVWTHPAWMRRTKLAWTGCFTGLILLGAVVSYQQSAEIKRAVAEGDALWNKGERRQAVEKYRQVLLSSMRSIDSTRRSELIERVMLADYERNDSASAHEISEKAKKLGVTLRPTFLTEAFFPFIPGSKRQTLGRTFLSDGGKMQSRREIEHETDGQIVVRTLNHFGNPGNIDLPLPPLKTERHRIRNGFVEHGVTLDNGDVNWSAWLKLGAKIGDTWSTNEQGIHENFKVLEFADQETTTHGIVYSVVIRSTLTMDGVGGPPVVTDKRFGFEVGPLSTFTYEGEPPQGRQVRTEVLVPTLNEAPSEGTARSDPSTPNQQSSKTSSQIKHDPCTRVSMLPIPTERCVHLAWNEMKQISDSQPKTFVAVPAIDAIDFSSGPNGEEIWCAYFGNEQERAAGRNGEAYFYVSKTTSARILHGPMTLRSKEGYPRNEMLNVHGVMKASHVWTPSGLAEQRDVYRGDHDHRRYVYAYFTGRDVVAQMSTLRIDHAANSQGNEGATGFKHGYQVIFKPTGSKLSERLFEDDKEVALRAWENGRVTLERGEMTVTPDDEAQVKLNRHPEWKASASLAPPLASQEKNKTPVGQQKSESTAPTLPMPKAGATAKPAAPISTSAPKTLGTSSVNVALASSGATVAGDYTGGESMLDGNTAKGYGKMRLGEPCIVTLPKTYELHEIRLKLVHVGSRYYQYLVEVSADGRTFEIVGDARIGEHRGWQTHAFTPRPVRHIRLTSTFTSDANSLYVHELEAY